MIVDIAESARDLKVRMAQETVCLSYGVLSIISFHR